MIRLTWAVVTARPWHALIVFLLGVMAIGAAVAAPAYARAARTSVAVSDVDNALPESTAVRVSRTVVMQPNPVDPNVNVTSDPAALAQTAPNALRINGFTGIYDATMTLAAGRDASDYTNEDGATQMNNAVLSYRSDACAHVTLVSGRCMVAPLEVVVSQSTAGALHGGVGSTMQIQFLYSVLLRDGGVIYFPVGRPYTLSIVGVYAAPAAHTDPYWSDSELALAASSPRLTGLIGADTYAAIRPYTVDQSYLAVPNAGALDPDRLDAVRADLTASLYRVGLTGYSTTSQLPALLDTIAADQRRASQGPTVAGAPLVVLCWFVIFLAVAQTGQARRPELALLKLRGLAPSDRWWLSTAESAAPLIGGGVVGYLAGHLAVSGFARLALDHPGSLALTGTSLSYAVVAMLGAMAAGLLAVRRDLAAPVTDLVRRVTRHVSGWRSGVVVGVVTALAAMAVFETRVRAAGEPSGLVLLGPPLIVLAVGLLLAGLLDPACARIGAFALRRGLIGLGLAALQIGRPRNSRRVVALLTVAVGLFAFAVTADSVSTRARDQQAANALGAPRILAVDAPDPTALLRGVRSVDPDGRFAMAVMVVPAEARSGAGLLAVDASRLATVAYWPGNGSATAAARAIAPKVPDSITVTDRYLLVDADFVPGVAVPESDLPGGAPVLPPPDSLEAHFAPLAGGPAVISSDLPLLPGHHTYRLGMPCLQGCRLTGLTTTLVRNELGGSTLTVTGLRSGDGTPLATAAELGGWIDASDGILTLRPGPSGLTITAPVTTAVDALIQPPDRTPLLPVVSAQNSNVRALPTLHGDFFANTVARTSMLPRLGTDGGVADLGLAILDDVLVPGRAEVWLDRAAPPDIVNRLAAAGLPTESDRTLADVYAAAGQRPTALGWRFLIVLSTLALLLGLAGLLLATTAESRTRADGLRALRAQGLSWRTATASGLIAYLSVVVCGVVFGTAAALLAWWLDGAYLPIVDGRPLGQGLPGWPSRDTLGWWIVAAAALLLVAVGATAGLARGARLGNRRRP